MATRCTIGKLNADGSVTAVYCHYDGYPDGVGKTLHEHYNHSILVNRLLRGGNMRSLENDPESGERYPHEKAQTHRNLQDYLSSASGSWANYAYLREGRTWKCYDPDSGVEVYSRK